MALAAYIVVIFFLAADFYVGTIYDREGNE